MGVPSSGEPPSSFELSVLVAVIVAVVIFVGSAVVFFARLALNW
jgi:hypothetical protein